ncbi:MAG: cytochrome b [Aromatoleum sp.]|nr:cytochrome b [Aromatoleum sp.]
MRDGEVRYAPVAIALHWISAVLILCGFTLGLTMTGLEFEPAKFRWYAIHKWIGITVFLLAFARLAWRTGHPALPPAPMPRWQQRAAAATHALLYALMLAIPVSGWIYSSATGVQVVYLGLFPLPDLVPKDKAAAAALKIVHVTLNYSMAALVFVHVWAALKHRFVDRDAVFARMLPLRWR